MCAAEIYDEWREKGARSVGRARMSDGAVYSYDRAEAGHLEDLSHAYPPTHSGGGGGGSSISTARLAGRLAQRRRSGHHCVVALKQIAEGPRDALCYTDIAVGNPASPIRELACHTRSQSATVLSR